MLRPTTGEDEGAPSGKANSPPERVLQVIAVFLNPYQLLQASQVSREWNKAFTTNEAWAHQNVYGIETSIYEHYLQACKESTVSEFKCIAHEISTTTNLYHVKNQLHLRTGPSVTVPPALTLSAPISFFRLVAQYTLYLHLSFKHVPEAFHQDKQLVYGLLRVGTYPTGLSTIYCNDRTAALSIEATSAFVPGTREWAISPELLKDRAVALHAVKRTGIAYAKLPEELRADLEIFYAYMKKVHQPASMPKNAADTTKYLDLRLHVPDVVKANRKVWLKMCSQYNLIQPLGWMSRELAGDWEIVCAALGKGPEVRNDALFICTKKNQPSPEILKNRTHLLKIIQFGYLPCFEGVPKELRNDKKVVGRLGKYMAENPNTISSIVGSECKCTATLGRLAAIHPYSVDTDHQLIERTLGLPRSIGSRVDKLKTRYAKRRLIFASLRLDYRPIPDKCVEHGRKDCRSC